MILRRKTYKWYLDQGNSLQELVDIHVRSWKRVAGYPSNETEESCAKVFEVQMGKMGDISRSFENVNSKTLFQSLEDGLKSIAKMCGNLIIEKQEIIQKLSTDITEMPDGARSATSNPMQYRLDLLKWAKSEHENHKNSLAKFYWNLIKDETWWQEENKEPESKDDLKQCFAVLDSKETDSPEEIKAKFRGLIKFYHPDNFQNNPEKRAYAEKKTKKINNAYDKLHERGIL